MLGEKIGREIRERSGEQNEEERTTQTCIENRKVNTLTRGAAEGGGAAAASTYLQQSDGIII